MFVSLGRNPFAFPGGTPRYNPAHLASTPNLRWAGVSRGNNFANFLTGAAAAIHNAPTSDLTMAGPAAGFSSASAWLSSSVKVETPTAFTVACIVTPFSTATSFGAVFTTGSFGSNDKGVTLNANKIQGWTNGNAASVTGLPVYAINVPYFMAISIYNSGGAGIQTLSQVQVNLLTGATFSGTANGTRTLGANGAAFLIGSNSGSNSCNADVHAVMYSTDALTVNQLRLWATAPWDFWYPQTQRSIMSLDYWAPGGASKQAVRAMVLA